LSPVHVIHALWSHHNWLLDPGQWAAASRMLTQQQHKD